MSIQAGSQRCKPLDALSYARKIFTAIGGDAGLEAARKNPLQLATSTVDVKLDRTPLEFFLEYQVVKLMSKYPAMDTGIDCTRAALEKFIWAERLCKETNDRFSSRAASLPSDRVVRILSGASRKIACILGPVPSFNEMEFSFGPGAAYGVRGETSVYNKVTSTLECTFALVDGLSEFLAEFPGWIPEGTHEVRLIPGSQLTFVPKDAKTHRPICIEPLLNGLMQKGYGSWIRRRLKRFGVDLDDQGVNQKLASLCIVDGLCTVDFSSASDTISYNLVMDLLPIDWFEALDCCRSPRFEYEGSWWNFQKFSSMGNAYTFELETLIFYSLACACCEELGIEYSTGRNLSVYGDDVIIPKGCFDLFSEIVVACGFSINEEKSFKEGFFYESCGHDYYKGQLVRPYLIKKRLNTTVSAIYACNTIRRIQKRILDLWSNIDSDPTPILERLDDVHKWAVSHVPKHLRFLGPEGFGDGHLIADLDEATNCRFSKVRRHRFFDAWKFKTMAPVNRPVLPQGGWPTPYALYFVRDAPSEVYKPRLPSLDLYPGDPPDNGSGYVVRSRVRYKPMEILCHSEWQGRLYWTRTSFFVPSRNEHA